MSDDWIMVAILIVGPLASYVVGLYDGLNMRRGPRRRRPF